MPTANALRLCPQLIVVPPTHSVYADVSADVFAVFRAFTPRVEGLSLDEAFLDVSGLRRHFESPAAVGSEIRDRLRVELGLPASVGVAPVKFVAKLASDSAKPDGLRLVRTDDVLAFLHPLPAEALWGVGPATMAALARLGVETIGDIAVIPLSSLVGAVGPAAGNHLHELANGRDPRTVTPDSEAKSISVEETFDEDLETYDVVETALMALAQRLSGRLRRAALVARTVTLKVRFADFATVTRSETTETAVDGGRDLFAAASQLLSTVDPLPPVRLIGIAATGLAGKEEPSQLAIDRRLDWDDVEDAVAEVRTRFGDDAVRPARLITGEER